jgi:hypothetical protein
MTDREGEGVGGIGGSRRLGEPKEPHDHRLDLPLDRDTATGHCCLDLARRMCSHRKPTSCRGHHHDGRCLRCAHHCSDVVLAENSLHCDRVRRDSFQPPLDFGLNGKQTAGRIFVACRPHDPHIDQAQRRAWGSVDSPEATPGQPRIDAQHQQRNSPRFVDRGSALSSHPAASAEGPPRPARHVPNICSDPTNLATSSIEPVETRRRDVSSGRYSPRRGSLPELVPRSR